jgi:hypothetical protein
VSREQALRDLQEHILWGSHPGRFVYSACYMPDEYEDEDGEVRSPLTPRLVAKYMQMLTYSVTKSGARPIKLTKGYDLEQIADVWTLYGDTRE